VWVLGHRDPIWIVLPVTYGSTPDFLSLLCHVAVPAHAASGTRP